MWDVGDDRKQRTGLRTLVFGERNHNVVLIPRVKGVGVRQGEGRRDVGGTWNVPCTVLLQVLFLWSQCVVCKNKQRTNKYFRNETLSVLLGHDNNLMSYNCRSTGSAPPSPAQVNK